MDPQDSPPASSSPARRRGGWMLGVGLVSAAAGFLMVSGASTANGTDLRAERRTQLTDLVRAREVDVARQTAQIAALQDKVDALTTQPAGNGQPPAAAGSDALAQAAGMLPVKGAGLSVALDDAPRQPGQPLPDGVQPDDLVVHQQDVQAVVNALWSGGAEAMTIMDQRVVATSAVRCVGNTLILQGRVYAPPFTISAVGDQAAMRQALDASSAVTAYRDWSDAVGLGYAVTDEAGLALPGYDGPLDLRYAKGSR